MNEELQSTNEELQTANESLRRRVHEQVSRSSQLRARTPERRALSRVFARHTTTTPPDAPPSLLCRRAING